MTERRLLTTHEAHRPCAKCKGCLQDLECYGLHTFCKCLHTIEAEVNINTSWPYIVLSLVQYKAR